MKTIYLFLFIAMFSPCFAQKSEQVKNYLGESKYLSNAPDSGRVVFHFQKGQLKRFTDGFKTFAQILPEAPGYSDADNAGKLLAVTVNGVRIAPLQKVAEASVPHSEIRTYGETDSIGYVKQIEELEKKGTFWQSQMWILIRPMWGLIMHFFWIGFPLLLAAMGVLWFWAKLSASEEFASLHYRSSKSLTLLVGSTWTVFILNSFFTIVYWELGPVTLTICVGVLAIFAFWSASRIIPNFRQKPGGRPESNNNNNTQRQLN
jgi:hypothetical protein